MKKTWTFEEASELINRPFMDLIFEAQTVHRAHFKKNSVQISTLLNIKTGACPENCSYCPQSAHYNTGLEREKLMQLPEIIAAAKQAKAIGSTRFCMGAAWREPKDSDLAQVIEAIKAVKDLGLETCVTLGMLKAAQAKSLKEAGLDYYNHNIDTSESFYPEIITTRTFEDRLDTIEHVRESGINVCCGGILGMGETQEDRVKMLLTLANLPTPPESLPLNKLIKIPGTPLQDSPDIDPIDFVRTIALARILMPKSFLRLSAGRSSMSDELQTLCFVAGINSIHFGEKLLTTKNADPIEDKRLFKRLGITPLNGDDLKNTHNNTMSTCAIN